MGTAGTGSAEPPPSSKLLSLKGPAYYPGSREVAERSSEWYNLLGPGPGSWASQPILRREAVAILGNATAWGSSAHAGYVYREWRRDRQLGEFEFSSRRFLFGFAVAEKSKDHRSPDRLLLVLLRSPDNDAAGRGRARRRAMAGRCAGAGRGRAGVVRADEARRHHGPVRPGVSERVFRSHRQRDMLLCAVGHEA